MELDLSSLWSWTIPLWGLFLIVLFLAGVLAEGAVLKQLNPSLFAAAVAAVPAAPAAVTAAPAVHSGGARNSKRHVRFSLPSK
jgi:hypothetical protein